MDMPQFLKTYFPRRWTWIGLLLWYNDEYISFEKNFFTLNENCLETPQNKLVTN